MRRGKDWRGYVYRVKRKGRKTFQRCVGTPHREAWSRKNLSALSVSCQSARGLRWTAHLLALCFFVAWVPVKNISQVAINMAAITGPITKPLRPKIAMPPSVEISTT